MNRVMIIRMKETTYWKPTMMLLSERPLAESENEPLSTIAGGNDVL